MTQGSLHVRTRRFENTLWERAESLRPAVHGVLLRGLTVARSPPRLRVPGPSGLSALKNDQKKETPR